LPSASSLSLPPFFPVSRLPPCSTLFPYTTLFRSLFIDPDDRARSRHAEATVARGARPRRTQIRCVGRWPRLRGGIGLFVRQRGRDRKSTRLNSSHVKISYAVFCVKKKKKYCQRST